MSKRYPGGVVRQTPATPTQSSASGVWNMTDVTQAQLTNNWPVANVPNPMSRSLRFRSSATAFLNRTPPVASNRKTWTWSGWVKRGILSSGERTLFNAGTTLSDTGFLGIRFTSDDKLDVTTGSTDLRQTTQVFRDPSAWYHIVVAMDTTQATGSNRVKVYVNGTQVTAFVTSNDPSLNLDTAINNNVLHEIARTSWNSAGYFDGYLAEVNFIDGQQLTPTSFGQYDQFGNWTSKKYTGTYGTNGFYLPFSNNSSTGTLGLDFSGNNNTWTTNNISLSTNTSVQTFSTVGTTSWTAPVGVTSVNYLVVGGGGGGGGQVGGGGGAGGYQAGTLSVISGASYTVTVGAGGAGTASAIIEGNSGSNSVFATITANGGGKGGIQGSATNTSGGSSGGAGGFGTRTGTASQGNLGGTTGWSGAGGGGAGAVGADTPNSNVSGGAGGAGTANSISGTSVTYAGGGGGGGYRQPGGAGGSGGGGAGGAFSGGVGVAGTANTGGGGGGGADGTGGAGGAGGSGIVILSWSSGSTSTYDSMVDVPTQWIPYNTAGDVGATFRGNYCVLNPLDNGGLTVTGGNLNLSLATATWYSIRASMAFPSTGKYYWEYTVNDSGNHIVGILDANGSLGANTYIYGSNLYGYGWQSAAALKGNNGVTSSYGSAATTNDVIMIAFDADNRSLFVGKNGTWFNSSNPATNTSPMYSSIPTTLTFFPTFAQYSTVSSATNFGQRPFSYTPPSGFKSLCTTNLPTSTIQQGNLFMNATTYTGTGATQNITNGVAGQSFQPDLVWIKNRSSSNSHQLTDSVRGVNLGLASDLTLAEFAGNINAFNTNGFQTTGATNATNASGQTYVGWQWKASNATAVTNTNGTINSQVSANTTSGFSVVTYTGTGGTGTTTVGHGCQVGGVPTAPSMVIIKRRNSTTDWASYHTGLTSTSYYLVLNSTAAQANYGSTFISPSSSTLTIAADSSLLNTSTGTYVAYCFAPIAGYSAFGSYTGNGSADGPFIYTGFRPRYVLIKTSSAGTNGWQIRDTSRSPYNTSLQLLYADTSNAEISSAGNDFDILSNGFKVRNSGGDLNTNGGTYIYMAFAEYPFKSALAR
jgi:hypothetical protein